MSFIRCTSNPEGLYAYDSVHGYIVLSLVGSEQPELHLSRRAWGALKRSYRRHDHADFTGRDLAVTHNVHVTPRGREVNTDDWSLNRHMRQPTNLKVRIRVPDHAPIYLWAVTYRYLMDNAIAQDNRARGRRTRI